MAGDSKLRLFFLGGFPEVMTVMYDGHVMAMAHSASATLGSKEEEEWEDGASWPIGHGFCCAFVH